MSITSLKDSPVMADNASETGLVELATELTIAWLANPNTRVSADDVPGFLQSMHDAVINLSSSSATGEAAETPHEEFTPAVTSRKSLASKDHIISMIDGKPYKSLKRHLSRHGLSPTQYRQRYGLKADYPMVSESYSQVRRDMANRIGLGRKPKEEPAKAPANGNKARKARAPKAAP